MSLKEMNLDNIWKIVGIGAISLLTLGLAVSFCQKSESPKKEELNEKNEKEEIKEEEIKEQKKEKKKKEKGKEKENNIKEEENNIVNKKVEEGTVEKENEIKEEDNKLKGKKKKNKNKKKTNEKKEEKKEIDFVVDDDRDGEWETVGTKKEENKNGQEDLEKAKKIYNDYLNHF